MEREESISSVLQKFDIFYRDELISKEKLIEQYMKFFAGTLDKGTHSVSLALHTGSKCFDYIAVAAATLYCIFCSTTSNDEILASLQTGDMVRYKGQRYRWEGFQEKWGKMYIVLAQDPKGKNGKSEKSVPAERGKNQITPYYGSSDLTDGRGCKVAQTNRDDFLAYLFPGKEIPSIFETAFVVVAKRTDLEEIGGNLKFVYGQKSVTLSDLIPISYFTRNGEEYQCGKNPIKAEAVLKGTGKIGTARELILENSGNKVVGLLVTDDDELTKNGTELSDLVSRNSLRFLHIAASLNADYGEHITEMYRDTEIFACTKEYLSKIDTKRVSDNSVARELEAQVSNIVNHEVTARFIPGGWSLEEYHQIRTNLDELRHSDWSEDDKNDFLSLAYSVVKLLTTACFPLCDMEQAVRNGMRHATVSSPKSRIVKLKEMAKTAGDQAENCTELIDAIEKKYNEFYSRSPKETALQKYVQDHADAKVAVIVPKAYYAEIMAPKFPDVDFETPNRFDGKQKFESIVAVGDVIGKRFDALQCYESEKIEVFLYDFETEMYQYRRKRQERSEKKLNAGTRGERTEDLPQENTVRSGRDERDAQNFIEFEQFIDSLNNFDILNYVSGNTASGTNTSMTEAHDIGFFTTGEQILFTRHYKAVVYEHDHVTEKNVEDLSPGDRIVFPIRNDFTKNIVDEIYERLLDSDQFNKEVQDATEKARYWKKVLRKYREDGPYTYNEIAKKLKKAGCGVESGTIGQWLAEDSHTVGPRDEKMMACIGDVTGDAYLSEHPKEVYRACKIVRKERRKILTFIAEAINKKLSGQEEDGYSKIVYDSVDRLSEILELESIAELDEDRSVGVPFVNRPMTKPEV